MAWNTKSLQLPESKAAKVPMGSPVAVNVGLVGKAYKDGWDIERAYREGMRKVVWVFRCIDAIAGNQSRLDVVLRKGNSRHGQVIKRHDLYDLLNSKSNQGENSFIFRYRVSSQLLMSTRGVFIEKVRGRDGRIIALQILPPQMTAPIPDPRTFVSGFEVELPNGTKTILKPQDVIWLRRPHPLDPYLSMTPMEAAGIAIEIENLARIYNRNFLMNDGRPGGLLVIRGEMDDDDKNELASRFRGNLNRTGATTVIESEGGADFVDTAANPRDAAYIQMRQITKEEIQSAFGVPESIIANSQGRCLRQSELVRLASGERVQAGDLVGKHFNLLTSSPEGHIEVPAWATLEQVEPIYRITTETGRILETNGRHPLYAGTYVSTREAGWDLRNGPKIDVLEWTPVAELAKPAEVGEWVIAVPTVITPTSHNDLSVEEGFVLGALVGDGTMTGDGKPVALCTPEGPFAKEFVRCVEALGDQVVHYKPDNRVDTWRVKGSPENRKGSGRGARNSVRTRNLLRRVGLMGTTSRTKFIPEEVFGASDEALAAFLGGLFAADGCVNLGTRRGEQAPTPCISLVTVSERLARDVQEALLRFGVNARIRFRSELKGGMPGMSGKTFSSWEVAISRSEDIVAFTTSIEVPGKQEKMLQAAIHCEEKARRTGWRTKYLNPGLGWEKVRSVEAVGEDQTIGISVPGHHTYLSVLWEHNTFANASEEGKVFWMETMLPHLEIIARGLDELDDQLYVDFDTDGVPVLILAKQERERYLMDEMRTGLISPNEYREATGRKKIESELMDSILANPNLTPIGNTEKPFDPAQQAPVDQGPPLQSGAAPDAPAMGEEAFAPPPTEPPADTPPEPGPAQEASGRPGTYSVKGLPFDDLDEKAEQAVDRWAEILDINLERLFERQQRVVLEKALGAKGRAALAAKTLTVDQVFDKGVWNRQVNEDLRPIVSGIVTEALRSEGVDPDPEEIKAYVDEQMAQTEKINDTTAKEIAAAITVLNFSDDDDKSEILRAALIAAFAAMLLRRKRRIAEHEATAAWNAGMYMAATRTGRQKMWRTRRDEAVRSQHRILEGKSVPVGEPFKVEGFSLRFPGDPLAPAHLTNGCRCRLRITR